MNNQILSPKSMAVSPKSANSTTKPKKPGIGTARVKRKMV